MPSLLHKERPDVPGELALRLEDIFFPDVDDELEVHAAVRQRCHAQEDRLFLVEVFVGLIHQRQTFRNNFIHFLQVCVVSYADLTGRYRSVAGTVLEIADVRVVDDLQVAARVLDRRRADADIAHRAPEIIQNDDISVDPTMPIPASTAVVLTPRIASPQTTPMITIR